MIASFGRVATHATLGTAISRAQRTWLVLLLSPGLSVPREQYTALSADLASRGYVVIALSAPTNQPSQCSPEGASSGRPRTPT